MMKKQNKTQVIIIFTLNISGHHLEYINHIYQMAIQQNEKKYVFVVPADFQNIKNALSWNQASNITFDYITAQEVKNYRNAKGIILPMKVACKILNIRIVKYSANSVFSILNYFGIIAPLFINKKVKLFCIEYDIYNHYLNLPLSFYFRVFFKLTYMVMAYCKPYSKVFILNDLNCTEYLNKKFNTDKFVYLPDPYIPLPEPSINIRKEYCIDQDKVIFSHFGSMSRRKGTLLIIDAIKLLDNETLDNIVFIFAGHISNDIKNEFYDSLKSLPTKARLIVNDNFCTYEYFAALSKNSDYILLPYLCTSRSSGIIGYAAQFNTPVISANGGLLDELVTQYRIGTKLTENNSHSLKVAIMDSLKKKADIITSDYCDKHKVEDFQRILMTYI